MSNDSSSSKRAKGRIISLLSDDEGDSNGITTTTPRSNKRRRSVESEGSASRKPSSPSSRASASNKKCPKIISLIRMDDLPAATPTSFHRSTRSTEPIRIISLVDEEVDNIDVDIKPNIVTSNSNNQDVMVVEQQPSRIVELNCPDASVTTSTPPTRSNNSTNNSNNSNENTNDNDDSPKVVAIKNQQLLPHMRQHCTEHLFVQDRVYTSGRSSSDDGTNNTTFCKLCFCYVCDKVASECEKWDRHCFARCVLF